jgi:hypothetical protein
MSAAWCPDDSRRRAGDVPQLFVQRAVMRVCSMVISAAAPVDGDDDGSRERSGSLPSDGRVRNETSDARCVDGDRHNSNDCPKCRTEDHAAQYAEGASQVVRMPAASWRDVIADT